MPTLYIDNEKVEVEDGATILDAARKLGVEIPTLCFLEGHAGCASCMMCAVRVNGGERFLPACATKAADAMRVESDTEEVHSARKAVLELLLGDHLGDCAGPCEGACPAHMNIPQMIRHIAAGRMKDAIATVKRHIALPAVLGRICHAPCEKACRRGAKDKTVSICLLKRYAADADLASDAPWQPDCKPATGKKVAIVGGGPTGLSAAYYLLQQGHAVTVFDDQEKPGGGLRHDIEEGRLPEDVLDAEIALIEELGAQFRLNTRLGKDASLDDLRNDFDAVLVAVGVIEPSDVRVMGLQTSAKGIHADKKTFATGLPGVFAAGGAVSGSKIAVRAVAAGRAAAVSIGQYMSGEEPTGEERPFSVHMGRLTDAEMEVFMAGASRAAQVEPSRGTQAGFTAQEACEESARCLHCDCRKRDNCKLRDHAQAYGAWAGKYKPARRSLGGGGGERRAFEQKSRHPEVVYEPGKCIDCGICVRIATEAREPFGLTFVGRGFDVRVAVPLGNSLADGLGKVAGECVQACPTGALAFKSSTGFREQECMKG